MERNSDQVVQPLRILFANSIAKDASTVNEDRWAASQDGTICALSDGASVSFDPATWAELLVQKFVREPEVDRVWLDAAVTELNSRYNRDALSWSLQAGFDRGSYATLLGVRPSSDATKIYILALGDSLAVWLDGHEILATFPYEKPEQFESSPTLLGTNKQENKVFSSQILQENLMPYTITELRRPLLMLMTDALGKWFMDNKLSNAVSRLLKLKDSCIFQDFVSEERSSGRLKRDDTTLIVMGRPDELSTNC